MSAGIEGGGGPELRGGGTFVRESRAMPTTLFADELQGPTWDRVRAIRRRLFDDSGQPLHPEVIPEVFHDLMPYASLLTTGEEATLLEFFDALDGPTRDAVMSAVEPLVDQLRAYGLGGAEGLQEYVQRPPEPPARAAAAPLQLSEELLKQAIAEIMSAQPTRQGPSLPEEDAMLDLARFYELNEERWALLCDVRADNPGAAGIVDALHGAIREHEALREYDFVEKPNPPADPDALAPLARELELPPDYVAFLAHANGWRGVRPGWELLGTDALAEAQEDATSTFEDCDTDVEVAKAALVIGRSENNAGMLFFDRRTRQADGRMELVEWLYEDDARHLGIEAFFIEQLTMAREGIAAERAARAEVEDKPNRCMLSDIAWTSCGETVRPDQSEHSCPVERGVHVAANGEAIRVVRCNFLRTVNGPNSDLEPQRLGNLLATVVDQEHEWRA
ncbi:MAG: hypothetical protein BGO98_25535 [Myxococcales bacterium 68-20]|nr:MAG: hypothetical protein BGO98_25535 [Myxococcales bacterium 68-20]